MKTKNIESTRLPLLALLAMAIACGDDAGPDASDPIDAGDGQDRISLDTGTPAPDTGSADSGTPADAANDLGVGDIGSDEDTGVADVSSFAPGQDVVIAGTAIRVRVGTTAGHTFAEVKTLLGEPTRQTPGTATRSYEWDLSVGGTLTVWFNNTGLDANPANVVGETDEALWLALSGAFPGADANGIAIGATRAAVEAAYGPAVRESSITEPAGTLLSYIRRGVLVAIDTGTGQVRSITVTRAYLVEPSAQIDLTGRRLRFPGNDLDLVTWTEISNNFIPTGGDDDGDITAILGPPDAQGTVNVGGQNLWMFAYSFIGFEITFRRDGSSGATGGALFISLHAPYYGTTAAAPDDHGIGTARATFETYLTARGFGAGAVSPSSADIICYKHGGNDTNVVGVTYSDPEAEVIAIILGLPPSACP